MKCSVETCNVHKIDARGLCHRHYERWRRTGSATGTTRRTTTADERFAKKYTVAENGCWLWTAAKDERGYGLFRAGRVIRAHIFSYEREYGPVPAGKELDHFACDTPSCCNPDHVRPVTARENSLRSNNACAWNLAKTHCVHGHPLTPDNVWLTRQGYRLCKRCAAIRRATRRARRAA